MLVIYCCITSSPPKHGSFIFSPFLWVRNLGVAIAGSLAVGSQDAIKVINWGCS